MGNRQKILIVIAARAGSKGLKNKNIKNMLGKPLIAYTIEQAIKWNRADDIVCSTDSKVIAGIARKYGARVPFLRPRRLAGGRISKIPVLRHALTRCEKIYKKKYDIVVDLDPTAPLRRISDLNSCLKIFQRQKPFTLFSVVKSRKNPYFNMVEKNKNGTVSLCKRKGALITARQQAPVVYDINASIYFYSKDYLADKRNEAVVSKNSIVYVMDELSRCDIDNEIDFKFTEFLIKKNTGDK